ncbi:DNA-protecting protein DprA [Xanthomonas campestris pv. campestris]|uniref:DNA-processing protein DprA n=1 Tax=Xanthomonas campestris TaxID=339 RepID=UPI00265BC393|nr:DNA-processing protein DprA [Xanthomonas campestris]MDO0787992.1 DNA-protecting protein DprA [Xanthomonas campestris pv. campestris]
MNVISASTGKLLALSMLKGVGPATLRMALNTADFVDAPIEAIARQVPRLAVAAQHISWSEALAEAERQVEFAEKNEARILSVLDADYPLLLKVIKDDPVMLFVKGCLPNKADQSVAVIGTREPTKHGVMVAERVTQFLAESGWSVVSGLALGLDAVAHRTALAAGGHTIAVLAHGLQTVAPLKHKALAQDILDNGGALVSEYRFGVDPRPEFFVKRDRIQAGLAQGVVMVQSDLRGGSLHASRAALDYGRWLAVPEPTQRDRDNMEPKVQANALIASNDCAKIVELLTCAPADVRKIIVLRSREDYPKLLALPSTVSESNVMRPAPPLFNEIE